MAKPQRQATFALVVAAIVLDGVAFGVLIPLLPELQERTGADDVVLGLTMASYAVPPLVLSIPLGYAMDRHSSRRLPLVGGLLFLALGSVLIPLAESPGPLALGRFAQGMSFTLVLVSGMALVADITPPSRRGEALGTAFGMEAFGALAGPGLGGLLREAGPFAAPFVLIAVAAVALALAISVLSVTHRAPSLAPAGDMGCPAAPRLAATLPPLAVITGPIVAVSVLEFVAPLELTRRLGLSGGAIGALFMISLALEAISAPVGGRWSDRRGRLFIATAGLVGTIAGVVGLLLLPGLPGAAAGLAAFGVGFGLVMGASIPWLDDVFGPSRGLAFGLMSTVFSIGFLLGPVLGGVGHSLWGRGGAYGCALVLCVVPMASLYIVRGTLPSNGVDQRPPSG